MPATRLSRSPIQPLALLGLLLAVAAAIALALAPASGVRAGSSHLVEIEDFAFTPATLTIQVGETVTWTNLDQVEHTATSTSGAFDSGLLGQGESYSVTFTEAGTYDYLCTPHPSMTGQIVVVAAPTAPTPAPSQATSGGELPDVATAPPPSTDPRAPIGIALLAALGLVLAATLRRRATR
ncbi:MAG TPA: cupredoxin family copper-binding protein [Candidatus Limnocylindria bacterium]|nr:cupredoxin family copper-binding protein [Candidatus Limnocylindria bacterium]